MAKIARVTCICYVEVKGANEYEALSEAEEMIEREYPLSDKTTLIIKETMTTSTDGCGVTYKKEENGNVRRDNCSEALSEEFADEGKREAVA
jgi:Tfp pilus assembly protein PilZ